MESKSARKKNAGRRWAATIVAAAFAAAVSSMCFVLMLSRVSNMHIIFYMVLGVSVILVISMSLWALGASERHLRLSRILRRCYVACLTVGLACFMVLQGLILSGARTEEADVDAVIVLGAGLRNDAPSQVLRSRLNAAMAYVEGRDGVPIIVAGGLGEGERITEAEAMFRYLSAHGIDESLIWKEDESTNTRENLEFSLALMEEKGFDVENATIAIVSNEFHLYRAKLIAERAGIEAVGVAAQTPGSTLRALYFFREAFALASEVLL